MASNKKSNDQLSKISFTRGLISMLNSPMLVSESFAQQFISASCMYLRGDANKDLVFSFYDPCDDDEYDGQQLSQSPNVFVIPIRGMLTNRECWYSCSYEKITNEILKADNDESIDTIVFDMETPGGVANGLFDLTSLIKDVGTRKNTIARVSDYALSAGYAIASSCNEIVCSQTSKVGSIGVVTTHASYEQMMKDRGIEITFIYAGDKKVNGNPYQSLSDSAKQDITKAVDGVYSMFVDVVSSNRDLPREFVIGTEAGIYSGSEALEAKLITKIEPHTETFVRLSQTKTSQSGDITMSTTQNLPEGQQPEKHVATSESQQPTTAETTPPVEQGNQETTPGINTATSDVLAILTACNSVGLSAMAEDFVKQGLTLTQAKEKLEIAQKVLNCGVLLGVPDQGRELAIAGIDLETSQKKLSALASVDAQINNGVHPNAGFDGSGKFGNWDKAFSNLNAGFKRPQSA